MKATHLPFLFTPFFYTWLVRAGLFSRLCVGPFRPPTHRSQASSFGFFQKSKIKNQQQRRSSSNTIDVNRQWSPLYPTPDTFEYVYSKPEAMGGGSLLSAFTGTKVAHIALGKCAHNFCPRLLPLYSPRLVYDFWLSVATEESLSYFSFPWLAHLLSTYSHELEKSICSLPKPLP